MSQFVVYSVPGSPCTRAVLAALIEKGAACRLAPLTPGEHRKEPHLSRHPFGKMPVLEHGDFVLYETQAILRYLDRILPAPSLTPRDVRAAARMDQIMGISDWYLFLDVNTVIGFQRIVGPRLMGTTPDEAVIAQALPKAHVVFAELSRLLGEKPYLASGELSLADLIVAPHMDFLAATPEWAVLTRGRENLIAWLARMNARKSLQQTTWERVTELAQVA